MVRVLSICSSLDGELGKAWVMAHLAYLTIGARVRARASRLLTKIELMASEIN